jgi:hypothetical protein
MKNRLLGLVSASLALVAASSVGSADASSADLRVGGTLVPGGACVMTLGDQGGSLNYGRIELNPDPAGETVLGEKKVKLFIRCPVAARYALIGSDGTGVGAGGGEKFGLVSDVDQAVMGHLTFRFDSASSHIEGKEGFYTGAAFPGDLATSEWGPSTFSIRPIPNGSYALGFVTSNGSFATPPPIKDLDTYLLVNGKIKPSSEIGLTDQISLVGELGFEIRYF